MEQKLIDSGVLSLSAVATIGYRRYDKEGTIGDSRDMDGPVASAGLRLEAAPSFFLSVDAVYNTIGSDHMELRVTPGIVLFKF